MQYRGVFSTLGGITIHVGDIMSTLGDTQYCGEYHDARRGYHEYRGRCSVPWEKIFIYLGTVGKIIMHARRCHEFCRVLK